MNKLYEIKVWDFNWTVRGHVELMKSCYLNVLIEDESWHFFWEGSYAVIRCTSGSVKPVLDFFDGYDYKTTVHGEWIDNIKTTRKYQNEFQSIFHGYSVLAMCYDGEGEFHNLMDRVAHCFFNMCWQPNMADHKFNRFGVSCQEYEALSYAYLGIRRANVVGFIEGRDKSIKEYDPMEDMETIQNHRKGNVQ